MLKIEYQLTFDEFSEGMTLAQKRISTQTEKQTRRSHGFPIMVVGVAAYVLLSLAVWPLVTRPWRGDADMVAYRRGTQTLLERIDPHLFWLGLLVIFIVLLMLLVRAQMARHRRALWEHIPGVQDVQTAVFDDDGVTEEHALARAFKRWTLFKRAEETETLFVLFSSDYTLDMFPKRVFDAGAADDFRALVRAKVQPPTNAFPVIPAAGPATPS